MNQICIHVPEEIRPLKRGRGPVKRPEVNSSSVVSTEFYKFTVGTTVLLCFSQD